MKAISLVCVLLSSAAVWAADVPEKEIAATGIKAKIQLPDMHNGFYRGTRFDWSGQIPSLTAGGHEYFGKWFPKYDPNLHDAIMGPVEEFISKGDTSPGYDEAKVGEKFVRIGVGAVTKAVDKPYERFRTYDIVDGGKWTVKPGRDMIEFIHELGDTNGYAYRYTKTIRLVGDAAQPKMIIEHSLRNTGRKPLETMQYNHNFFVIDGQPTGPEASVKFVFDPKSSGPRPLKAELAAFEGRTLTYKKQLVQGESAFTEIEGFGSDSKDYDFRVEHKKAGAGVRIQGDKPIQKIIYWSIPSTLCPEAYIDVSAKPGEETRWTYTYTFYQLK
ncbi:MAG: hypothetical protein SGI92_27580 [Bryobacteraceae bacterium]|nr:hypothetical protein [Bryobacteraceae bacterium]